MQGVTAEEICQQNPDLDRSLFYAALAYYFANKAQVESDIEQDRLEGSDLAGQFPAGSTRATSSPR